jgi:hypothetical protein
MRFGFDGINHDKYLALKGKMQNKKLSRQRMAGIKKPSQGRLSV